MPELLAVSPLIPALAAFLLPCVASALAALVAWQASRRLGDDALRETALAFAVAAALSAGCCAQAVLLIAGRAAAQVIPSPLLRALDLASAAAVGWALVGRARHMFLLGALSTCGVLGAFTLSLWRLTGVEPAWVAHIWCIGNAAIFAAVTFSLWTLRYEQPRWLLVGTALLTCASFFGAIGLTDGMVALRLVAFPLLPIALMQLGTRDLQSAQMELVSLSEHSLRQTQQLFTVLRTSTALVSHFEATTILQEAVEGVALGVGADSALIALLDDTGQTLRLQAFYPPRPLPRDVTFVLSSQPAIAHAVQLNQPVAWTQPQRGVHALATLMGSDVGPGIIQPMIYQERVLGIIVALNGRRHRAFTESEQRMLEAFGVQVAAAAENAFLYRRLDTQARELARMLAAREDEANRQAAILESIADGVIVTDVQDQVMLANAAAAQILDIPCDELVGRPFGAIFGQMLPVSGGAILGEPISPDQGSTHAIFQIGPRFIQSSLAPVQGPHEQHQGMVAVLRDVTAERAAEQAKTEFISTISHELRTPLTSIKGYADLLAAGAAGEVNATQRNFADAIRSGAQRLTAIVNAVIRFTEMEQGTLEIHPQPLDLGAVIAEVVGSMRSKFEARGLTLSMDVATDLPQAQADPDCAQQIIEQLLDNAMRFTPDSGQVSVRARPSWDGLNVEQPAFVAVAVTDTGVGLTRPDLERVFERFYRAENPLYVSAGGLGIGLTIARGLAQTQGGQLWAESPDATDDHPGHGSVFTLLLPTVCSSAAAPPQPEAADMTAWLEKTLSFLDQG